MVPGEEGIVKSKDVTARRSTSSESLNFESPFVPNLLSFPQLDAVAVACTDGQELPIRRSLLV